MASSNWFSMDFPSQNKINYIFNKREIRPTLQNKRTGQYELCLF